MLLLALLLVGAPAAAARAAKLRRRARPQASKAPGEHDVHAMTMLDKDEETIWREMERMPDLQKLVARYGRYDLITPEA